MAHGCFNGFPLGHVIFCLCLCISVSSLLLFHYVVFRQLYYTVNYLCCLTCLLYHTTIICASIIHITQHISPQHFSSCVIKVQSYIHERQHQVFLRLFQQQRRRPVYILPLRKHQCTQTLYPDNSHKNKTSKNLIKYGILTVKDLLLYQIFITVCHISSCQSTSESLHLRRST